MLRINTGYDEKWKIDTKGGDTMEKFVHLYEKIRKYVNPETFLPLPGSFSGRAASCTEGTVGAYLDNECKVGTPGNGDRVWAGCQNHEMLMAIPFGKLEGVIEGLEKSHQKGIRYPIPTYLRYRPEVAFSIPLRDVFQRPVPEK
jgi:hypothetical protein